MRAALQKSEERGGRNFWPEAAVARTKFHLSQMLEQKQAVAALNQQIASRKNQLTETEFSLHELPTVMAQKVQALRNELVSTERALST